MEKVSSKQEHIENPFLGDGRDAMWKRLESLPKKRITKEELLKKIQRAKSQSKK